MPTPAHNTNTHVMPARILDGTHELKEYTPIPTESSQTPGITSGNFNLEWSNMASQQPHLVLKMHSMLVFPRMQSRLNGFFGKLPLIPPFNPGGTLDIQTVPPPPPPSPVLYS